MRKGEKFYWRWRQINRLLSFFFWREINFVRAMKKPETREAYVEKIVKVFMKPGYIEKIKYLSPEELEVIKRKYGFVPFSKVPMIIRRVLFDQTESLVICIFPYAFSGELLKREEDFISSLLHEYILAEAIYQQRVDSIEISAFETIEGKLNGELFIDIAQLAAIRDEIYISPQVSPEYKEEQLLNYLIYYTNIWDHSERMDSQFIESLKIEYFHPCLLGSPNLFREANIWYFKDPIGKEYYLPQEIVQRYGKE